MNFEIIKNDTVRRALEALHYGNQPQFEELLAGNMEFIHNGQPEYIGEWAKLFFFEGKTQFLTISRVEDDGCTVWAELESPFAGKIAVKLLFTLSNNKIVYMNAGRP